LNSCYFRQKDFKRKKQESCTTRNIGDERGGRGNVGGKRRLNKIENCVSGGKGKGQSSGTAHGAGGLSAIHGVRPFF